MISVQKLSKTFHVHRKSPGLLGSLRALVRRETTAKPAVREVSFQVQAGEIVGLIGANGAGKTTLVKMLAGIIHPTSGEARVLGFNPWERDDRFRAQIALVMGQKAQLWWDLPAADDFLLLKEIYRIPDAEYRRQLDYLVGVLDVGKEMNVQVRQLSLGERMKMELIATLLHNPRVVFLDEPTIGLDLTAQRAIRDFLLHYREAHQPAMLLTSHYMEDIEQLCRRILIMREGELVYDGSLETVMRTYADHKVVTARLLPTAGTPHSPPELQALGKILGFGPDRIQIQVPRDRVAQAAGYLLRQYPVGDLTIEEPEIGTVIERIMQGKQKTP